LIRIKRKKEEEEKRKKKYSIYRKTKSKICMRDFCFFFSFILFCHVVVLDLDIIIPSMKVHALRYRLYQEEEQDPNSCSIKCFFFVFSFCSRENNIQNK